MLVLRYMFSTVLTNRLVNNPANMFNSDSVYMFNDESVNILPAVRPTCSPVTWPTCSPVPRPTCSPVPRPTCSPVPRPPRSTVTWPTCSPVPRPICSPVTWVASELEKCKKNVLGNMFSSEFDWWICWPCTRNTTLGPSVKSSIPSRWLSYEELCISMLAIPFECTLREEKWLVTSIYLPPSQNGEYFQNSLTKIIWLFGKHLW